MNYLTDIENNFLEALKADYTKRGEKSFFTLLFTGIEFSGSKQFNQEINDFMELDKLDKNELSAQTQWLMNCMELMYVGKYQNHFVGTNSDAEVFSIGQEIQNIPYYIISAIVADMDDDFEQVKNHYLKHEHIDFVVFFEEYRQFCLQYGLVLANSFAYVINQADTFNGV